MNFLLKDSLDFRKEQVNKWCKPLLTSLVQNFRILGVMPLGPGAQVSFCAEMWELGYFYCQFGNPGHNA